MFFAVLTWIFWIVMITLSVVFGNWLAFWIIVVTIVLSGLSVLEREI